MQNLINQISAAREGGAVERCHATPHIGTYNNAQHCYGAVSLILILHPNPSVNLIRAVQFHDVAERWLGDVPATGKTGPLRSEYEEAEAAIQMDLNLMPLLDEEDHRWLRAVDLLDLWLWTREQLYYGNSAADEIRQRCERALDQDFHTPSPVFTVLDWLRDQPHKRLSSVFGEIVGGFGGSRKTQG